MSAPDSSPSAYVGEETLIPVWVISPLSIQLSPSPLSLENMTRINHSPHGLYRHQEGGFEGVLLACPPCCRWNLVISLQNPI